MKLYLKIRTDFLQYLLFRGYTLQAINSIVYLSIFNETLHDQHHTYVDRLHISTFLIIRLKLGIFLYFNDKVYKIYFQNSLLFNIYFFILLIIGHRGLRKFSLNKKKIRSIYFFKAFILILHFQGYNSNEAIIL